MTRRLVDLIVIPSVVVARLAAFGLDAQALLRHAGLPADLFASGKARLNTRQLYAAWEAVAHMSADPMLGLRIGAESATEHYDVASIAALHSPDFGEALRRLARYKRLTCPETVRIEHSAGEVRVQFQWLLANGHSPILLTDATFASMLELARRGTGTRVVPRRVELTRSSAHEGLARHFGCAPRFNAAADQIVFDEALLSVPFVTHNQDLLAMLLPGLEAALDALSSTTAPLVDQARAAMARSMHGERPSIQAVARILCVSPRTLQRRLELAGTTYQRLLDEVRHQAARHLLEDTDLEAGEIAFALGFEELNSFTRAFRSWEGTTPVRWRADCGRGRAAILLHPPHSKRG
jgi:AraC-like DNA-binding protein